MRPWWMFRIAKFVVLIVVATAVLGVVVMLLWNALIPDLFKAPQISFWQAVALLVLSHILLRGWGRWRYGNGWRHDRWKRRFEEKLSAMAPEEREKFREEWRRRCGPYWRMSPEDGKKFGEEWQKWSEYLKMTPDEKQKFREEWRQKWGWDPEERK